MTKTHPAGAAAALQCRSRRQWKLPPALPRHCPGASTGYRCRLSAAWHHRPGRVSAVRPLGAAASQQFHAQQVPIPVADAKLGDVPRAGPLGVRGRPKTAHLRLPPPPPNCRPTAPALKPQARILHDTLAPSPTTTTTTTTSTKKKPQPPSLPRAILLNEQTASPPHARPSAYHDQPTPKPLPQTTAAAAAAAAMSVVDIKSKAQFDALIKENPFVALQAHATWCGPCKAISPMFNKHASSLSLPNTYAFARFDTDEVPDLAFELGIRSIPAFFFFENGDKASDLAGANPPALKKAVESLSEKAKAEGGKVSA
ncbi:hypothetical protein Purlil1_4867 [Purpureocillium lilacinum]|uniref:Thioredoxin domain-containing protein n=1 Tax=Purpureocillium lilacinum TaxID=33203 RepID=A0ABR0C2W2_PURLI|nr:hypothetical protein Purlil1_4867 [Purpureocillium lilacinum]